MSKYHVPIDNEGYNGWLYIRPHPELARPLRVPGVERSDIILSVISGHFDMQKQIYLHLTKQEAVQLANALHSLVVEIDRKESKDD